MGDASSSGVAKLFETHTEHLNEKHAIFLAHWLKFLSSEEAVIDRNRHTIWTNIKERKLSGRYISLLRHRIIFVGNYSLLIR